MTTREYVYNNLSAIMSPEDADEWAEACQREEQVVADCVILTARGKTQDYIADYLGMSQMEVSRNLQRIEERAAKIFV